jgi:hypothetical protein
MLRKQVLGEGRALLLQKTKNEQVEISKRNLKRYMKSNFGGTGNGRERQFLTRINRQRFLRRQYDDNIKV